MPTGARGKGDHTVTFWPRNRETTQWLRWAESLSRAAPEPDEEAGFVLGRVVRMPVAPARAQRIAEKILKRICIFADCTLQGMVGRYWRSVIQRRGLTVDEAQKFASQLHWIARIALRPPKKVAASKVRYFGRGGTGKRGPTRPLPLQGNERLSAEARTERDLLREAAKFLEENPNHPDAPRVREWLTDKSQPRKS